MADSLRIYLSFVFSGILWLVYTPLYLSCFAWFYKHRNIQMLKKRYSSIRLILICELIVATIFLPSYLLLYSDAIIDFKSNRIYVFYPIYVGLATILFMSVWKQWLYYFDTHLATMSLNNQWKQFLNPTAIANNWFIVNKKRFATGSSLHLKFLAAILTLFMATTAPEFIMKTDVYTKEFVFGIFGAFWAVLAMIVLGIIRYKTPELEDLFLIRQELLYVVVTLCTYIVYPIMHAINRFMFTGHRFQVVIFVLQQWYLGTVLLIVFFILSVWPILKNRHWVMDAHHDNLSLHQADHVMLAVVRVDSHTPSSNPKQCVSRVGDVTLPQVLKNETTFNSFMQHLIKEFSIEIMLALIELSQFQERMRALALSTDQNIANQEEWKLSFDLLDGLSYIPQSSIVFDALNEEEVNTFQHMIMTDITKRKQMEFLIRAHKIYEKYFDSGSDFEINISSTQKKFVTGQLSLFDAWKLENVPHSEDALDELNQLFKLFSTAIGSMRILLQYSFTRFKMAGNGIDRVNV
eukprot:545256_1